MADYRQIHTHIWKDAWFLELNSNEKLLFIYLFSNERASVSGLYDLSVKVMAFETDLSKEQVESALQVFIKAGKIAYNGQVIWVKKLRQYNASSSVKVKTRIEKDVDMVSPCDIKKQYCEAWQIPYPELQIPYPENESEQEQEQEQEQDTKDQSGDKPRTPSTFREWLKLVEESPNKAGSLGGMLAQLYPYYETNKVNFGWLAKLVKANDVNYMTKLIWDRSSNPPVGDPLRYIAGALKRAEKERQPEREGWSIPG